MTPQASTKDTSIKRISLLVPKVSIIKGLCCINIQLTINSVFNEPMDPFREVTVFVRACDREGVLCRLASEGNLATTA